MNTQQQKPTVFQPYATSSGSKKSLGLGDRVEKLAKPIARVVNSKCLDKETDQLKPQSPCAKRRDGLNKVGRAIGIGV